MSDQPTVHAALAEVMAEIGHVPKDRTAPGVSYKFVGIADILARAQPAFARHGMALLPHEVVSCEQRDRTTKNGGSQIQVDIHVRWRLYGPAGDWIQAESWGQAFDTSDKASNKAHTAAHKVALRQIFAIPEDADDQDMERPELGTPSVSVDEPAPLGKRAAGHHVKACLRERGEAEDRLKDLGAQVWADMALDNATPYTLASIQQAVADWYAKAEPFDDVHGPPAPRQRVDIETGELVAEASLDPGHGDL